MAAPSTYFQRDALSDVVGNNDTNRKLLLQKGSGVGTVTLTFPGGAETRNVGFYTEPQHPGLSSWPAGIYKARIDVVDTALTLTHEIRFLRANSAGVPLAALAISGSMNGTGIHEYSANLFSAQVSPSDRFLLRISVTRTPSKGVELFTVNVNLDDHFLVVPWDAALPERLSGSPDDAILVAGPSSLAPAAAPASLGLRAIPEKP